MRALYLLLLTGAIYPLHYLSNNIEYFDIRNAWAGLVFSLLITTGIFLLCLLVTRRIFSALFLTLPIILWFWSYDFIAEATLGRSELDYDILSAIASGSVATLYLYCRHWFARAEFRRLFVIFLHSMVLIPIASIAYEKISSGIAGTTSAEMAKAVRHEEELPDIYHIVLDAYGRDDVLKRLYGVKENGLTRFLEEQGFYVAHESYSNYMSTFVALPSLLHFDYMQNQIRGKFHSSAALKKNTVSALLKQHGYRTYFVDSGFSMHRPFYRHAKAIEAPLGGDGNVDLLSLEFLSGMIEAVPVFPYKIDAWIHAQMPTDDNYANMMLKRFQVTRNAVRLPGPKYVFAHFTVPHLPFVFDEHGILPGKHSSSMRDGSDYTKNKPKGIELYQTKYRQQLLYTNQQAKRLVEHILRERPNSVILVQGDHGPRSTLNWKDRMNSDFEELFGILNSYYFPDRNYSALYPGISPVNSYRVVFNQLLGTHYKLLPDRSFMHTGHDLSTLQEITSQLLLKEKSGKK